MQTIDKGEVNNEPNSRIYSKCIYGKRIID